MVNKRMGAKIALILVTLAVIFTACKSMPAAKMNDKFAAGMELAAWKGEWVSADIIKDNPSLKAAYKKTAADMRFYTLFFLHLWIKTVKKCKFQSNTSTWDKKLTVSIPILCGRLLRL